MEEILILGKTTYREREMVFGIKNEDRRKHIYILGKTGTGKTTLLLNMMIQDLKWGNGFIFFDPHGDAVKALLDYIPENRINDIIYLNPSDIYHPFGFNPLENLTEENKEIIVNNLITILKKIWKDIWNDKLEYFLTNLILSLSEYPGATLLDVSKILEDKNFREKVLVNIKNKALKSFFAKEVDRYFQEFSEEVIFPLQNKMKQIMANRLLRNIIGQSKSSFNLREIIEEGKVLLANLSLGELGEENVKFLGSILIQKIHSLILERAKLSEEERKDFYFYLDEFQVFADEIFINLLSEARKFHLGLIISHQYLDQIDQEIVRAILGNIGTLIVFRIGSNDVQTFYEEFDRKIKPEDFLNLPSYKAYIRLLVDGKPLAPFLFETFPLPSSSPINYKEKIISLNHSFYTRKREFVEDIIDKIYFQKESREAWCRICGQKVTPKKDIEICSNCQQTAFSKMEANLKKKKEIETSKKVDLESILKKLENESH